MSNKKTIGFIGLGVMGEPMCRNLAKKSGQRVLSFDLSPEPMKRLAEHGAEPCPDVAELMKASDVVMVCLPSGKAVTALLAQILPHVREGQTFLDLSTSGVDVARMAQAQLREKGARFLDTPIARTRQAAENGTLLIMVGGEAAVLEEVRPLLDCIASDVTHCGPTGAGQITKILNNMVMFQTGLALSEAYAIAQRAGFDAASIFTTMSQGSGDSFALRNHGAKAIIPGAFPERAFSVQYARKDLSYAIAMAKEMGLEVLGCDAVDASFQNAIDAGQGEKYWPVISRVIDGTATAETERKAA
ncbi:MAG: NAD(P)-dependent oxidoreductase [Pseudomonadota bacterium]